MGASISINGVVHSIEPNKTIMEAIQDLGHTPDAFVFIVDGRPVPMDKKIDDGMNINALKVASGG